ncbi:MAG: hypothetical protein U7123_10840 [Potamolinea sp.]
MQNFNSFPDKEWLEQINLYLEKVGKLAEVYGKEWVENVIKGWSDPTVPDTSFRANRSPETSPTTSKALLVGQVKTLGLNLNDGMINLINHSNEKQVTRAIAKYKTYRPLKNPEGLFYTILKNESKSDQSNF